MTHRQFKALNLSAFKHQMLDLYIPQGKGQMVEPASPFEPTKELSAADRQKLNSWGSNTTGVESLAQSITTQLSNISSWSEQIGGLGWFEKNY